MLSINLQGGLGNQMFQVAVTYNLAIKNKDVAVFNFNESYTPLQGKQVFKYKNNVFKNFTHKSDYTIKNTFDQKGFSFEKIPYESGLLLNGFFQSEKFFEENKKDVVEKFLDGMKSDKEKWSNIVNFITTIEFNSEKPLVGVHVRRGDYLEFAHIHTPCGLDYYKKALSIVKEKIGDFKPIFISDDKEWCVENFKDLDCLVSPFDDEIEDLILMINCKHNIIANSSFSWWGAYLNQNLNKIVIAPKRWFGPEGPQNQQDIIPKNWIKI